MPYMKHDRFSVSTKSQNAIDVELDNDSLIILSGVRSLHERRRDQKLHAGAADSPAKGTQVQYYTQGR